MSTTTDYYKNLYLPKATQAANDFGIPSSIFNALVGEESSWNPYAVSSAGAIGLTQLMPGTAKDVGVNAYNPDDNLNGGAQYLSQLFKRFGNWTDALAAYNLGPNADLQTALANYLTGKVTNDTGYDYAAKILAASGYTGANTAPVPGSPSGNGQPAATATAPSFLSDPVGNIVASVKPYAMTIGLTLGGLLLIGLGIWAILMTSGTSIKIPTLKAPVK